MSSTPIENAATGTCKLTLVNQGANWRFSTIRQR
jgi:hypothetical protein